MTTSFFELPVYLLLVIIFLLIVFSGWLGYNYKKRQLEKDPNEAKQSVRIVEGATFSMLSLLMGFTFSVAITKFEAQRRVLVEEATYIKTAVLRSELYPDSVRNLFRNDFKDYIEARISYYSSRGNDAFTEAIKRATIISDKIWKRAIDESKKPENAVRTAQMIPALNNMIEVVTTRDSERVSHVPPLVLWVLLTLILLGAFLLGVDVTGRKRNKLPIFSYAFVMSLTLNLIIELSQPSSGLINFDSIQRKFIDLRELVR
jgi:hypothetical protein